MAINFIGDGNPDGICLGQNGEKVAFFGGTPSVKVTLTDLASSATIGTTVSVINELIDELGSKGLINVSISEAPPIIGYDLNNLSAVQVTKSVATEDANPRDVIFNNDGTKVYMCGSQNDSIFEYNLTTAYDLSTLSVVQATKSVASEDSFPRGIAFNDDGTKIFMVGSSNASIYEYNLSTAFDISTLSTVQVTKSILSEDDSPNDITFNNDGTKIFMVGQENNSIYEYNLSTAFDLSTLSVVQVTKSVGSEDGTPTDVVFNDIGDKIFMVGNQTDSIFEYDLGTAFDISTLSTVQVTKSVASEDGSPRGIAFNDNGTKIFMVGNGNDAIHEYNL